MYVHEDDADVMNDARLNLSASYTPGYTFSGAECLKDGQELHFAGYHFKAIHTPGHTRGGVCYYVEDEGVLFSGDTLFQNSVGRTDFVGSSMLDLVASIRERLFVLPDEMSVRGIPGRRRSDMRRHIIHLCRPGAQEALDGKVGYDRGYMWQGSLYL